ncbi:hypothetical protein E5Q_06662 [Mixia osmundae IAM 14324]|uniref:NTF2 domain-containing protein n=1 Tax=Mixia osmundae (strain CBS 9802 / IAM 14324 / JCM 22182 / KY 12970) TaxID=764103 RepID=G7EAU9_MIXOS|nr:hypothetical protein E5Q_06662 [Mixia osmundae IAM 14324]
MAGASQHGIETGHAPHAGPGAPNKPTSSEIGWMFIPQYYTFLNKDPARLHCFYHKRSTLIHGTEGEVEEAQVCHGQSEIHEKLMSLGFNDCKVFVSTVDSLPSQDGGIIVQVIGEMSNNGGSWRKFSQTFFLAAQPNGYFVLNDIFRFIKEEGDTDAIEESAIMPPEPAPSARPVLPQDTPNESSIHLTGAQASSIDVRSPPVAVSNHTAPRNGVNGRTLLGQYDATVPQISPPSQLPVDQSVNTGYHSSAPYTGQQPEFAAPSSRFDLMPSQMRITQPRPAAASTASTTLSSPVSLPTAESHAQPKAPMLHSEIDTASNQPRDEVVNAKSSTAVSMPKTPPSTARPAPAQTPAEASTAPPSAGSASAGPTPASTAITSVSSSPKPDDIRASAPTPVERATTPPAQASAIQPDGTSPSAPKTWANLAAASAKKPRPPSTIQSGPSSSASLPAAPMPTIVASNGTSQQHSVSAYASPSGQQQQSPQQPATATRTQQPTPNRAGNRPPYEVFDPASVLTPNCFIKGVVNAISNQNLRAAVSPFGSIRELEINRLKVCAFLEYNTVESARACIVKSHVPPGGIPVQTSDGTIYVYVHEKKKIPPGANVSAMQGNRVRPGVGRGKNQSPK